MSHIRSHLTNRPRRSSTLLVCLCIALLIGLAALAGCGGRGGGGSQAALAIVTGRVTSAAPLPALTVRIVGGAASAPVQADGSFTLTGVPPGARTLEVVSAGDVVLAVSSVTVPSSGATLEPIVLPSGGGVTAGIAGTVYRGPINPVSTVGDPNQEPYAGARLTVMTADGAAVVADVTSDANGRFEAAVAPGKYRVVPVIPNAGLFPRAEPVDVTVTANQVTQVQIVYDTGIR